MKTAEIFDGKKNISVKENQIFKLDGVFNWDVGSCVVFQVSPNIEIETCVKAKDGTGSQFLVTEIRALDELAEITLEANDVEVETVSNLPEVDVKFVKKKFTKKDLVAFIDENNLDIDYKNMTKLEIVSALRELNYM